MHRKCWTWSQGFAHNSRAASELSNKGSTPAFKVMVLEIMLIMYRKPRPVSPVISCYIKATPTVEYDWLQRMKPRPPLAVVSCYPLGPIVACMCKMLIGWVPDVINWFQEKVLTTVNRDARKSGGVFFVPSVNKFHFKKTNIISIKWPC